MTPKQIRSFLNRLCDLAAQETLPRFRSSLNIFNKQAAGFDPVTEADREAERVIRKAIVEAFPEHGILGEEHGVHNEQAAYQWIIDPVDGTRSFVTGVPLWGTLVGLYRDGVPLAGVMDQPFTGERFLADTATATLSHRGEVRALTTSACDNLSEAILMTTAPELHTGNNAPRFDRLSSACRLIRYGTDCYAFCLLAAGHVDVVIESGVQLYDIAALVPIVKQAGGVFTDWEGNPNSEGGNVVASANGKLHEAVLKWLGSGS